MACDLQGALRRPGVSANAVCLPSCGDFIPHGFRFDADFGLNSL